jgi:hypothetical protein
MKRYTRSLLLVALIAGLSLTAGVVGAGPKILDFGPDTCTTTNCNSTTTNGTYTHDQNDNADPFIVQVFTNGNDCVRIDVTSQGTDLEATLTCPNGQTWRNDDRSATDIRPLIRAIQNTAHRGWCTLTISHFAGEGVNADFTFRYGRYNIGNSVNCPSNFGGPFGPEVEADKPDTGAIEPQRKGGSID